MFSLEFVESMNKEQLDDQNQNTVKHAVPRRLKEILADKAPALLSLSVSYPISDCSRKCQKIRWIWGNEWKTTS